MGFRDMILKFESVNFNKIVFWFSALSVFGACSTDFEVYDEPKDIYAAYCVLNPSDSVQYVRINKAFQVKGDAILFAGANDLSVKGLPVKLSGNGNTWVAEQVDSFPLEPGIFFPYPTVYRFKTGGISGQPVLTKGQTYTLEVGAEDSSLFLTAQTTIPNNVTLYEKTRTCGFQLVELIKAELNKKFRVSFSKGTGAYGYELRVDFHYKENTLDKTAIWGPTQIFSDNQRCVNGTNDICFQFEEYELIGYWQNLLPQIGGTTYSYIESPSCVTNALIGTLPKSIRIEVTAVDNEFGKYMLVNNPRVSDPTGNKPEYTNFTGNVQGLGIFGSRIQDEKWVLMNDCSEFLIGLSNTPALPSGCTPP